MRAAKTYLPATCHLNRYFFHQSLLAHSSQRRGPPVKKITRHESLEPIFSAALYCAVQLKIDLKVHRGLKQYSV